VRIPTSLTGGLLAVGLIACSGATCYASALPASGQRAANVRAPKVQLGIDIDYYSNPAINVVTADAAMISYIKGLHANSVSISFPFYISGPKSSTVYGNATTPTPAQLGALATDAEHAGLYVSIRPLMDEGNLDGARPGWMPADPAAWFASYGRFLKPYARMAQTDRIPELIEGAELTRISDSKYWTGVNAQLRKVYRGTLAYSNNFGRTPVKGLVSKQGVAQLLDDYHPVDVPSTASVATLTKGWNAYLKTQPRGIVISEIGITAEDNAYSTPWLTAGLGAFNPAIQVRWFTAACNSVTDEHLGGIYFWSVLFGQAFNVPPGPADAAAFSDGPGAAEIATCFKKLG
jgi:hypothetical protein